MISEHLNNISRSVQAIEKELQNTPEIEAISELLKACRSLDDYYQTFCERHDELDGYPLGTTYKEGCDIEFYIEASWWHEISLQLRKLAANKWKP